MLRKKTNQIKQHPECQNICLLSRRQDSVVLKKQERKITWFKPHQLWSFPPFWRNRKSWKRSNSSCQAPLDSAPCLSNKRILEWSLLHFSFKKKSQEWNTRCWTEVTLDSKGVPHLKLTHHIPRTTSFWQLTVQFSVLAYFHHFLLVFCVCQTEPQSSWGYFSTEQDKTIRLQVDKPTCLDTTCSPVPQNMVQGLTVV